YAASRPAAGSTVMLVWWMLAWGSDDGSFCMNRNFIHLRREVQDNLKVELQRKRHSERVGVHALACPCQRGIKRRALLSFPVMLTIVAGFVVLPVGIAAESNTADAVRHSRSGTHPGHSD